jgi:hypothetical protein
VVEWAILVAVTVIILSSLSGLLHCQTICVLPASPKAILDPTASPRATNWLRAAFQQEGYKVVSSCTEAHDFSAWLYQPSDRYASYGTGYLLQNTPTGIGNVGSLYTWDLGYLLQGDWILYVDDSAGNSVLERRSFELKQGSVHKAAVKLEKYQAKRWAAYQKQMRKK